MLDSPFISKENMPYPNIRPLHISVLQIYKEQNGKFLINTDKYPRTVLTFPCSTSILMALGAKLT